MTKILFLLPAFLLMACTELNSPETPTAYLSTAFLFGDEPLDGPLDTAAYAPGDDNIALPRIEGRLRLNVVPDAGRIRGHIDWFGYLAKDGLKLSDLPPFDFEFVQDGNMLIPALRGPQASTHPYWEFILEPGRVWEDPVDGGWLRVSLPFSLQERNANCTHNGLMTFLLRPDGPVSRVVYQVGSETCQYLQVDLWGVLPASWSPGEVEGADLLRTSYREEASNRLPVRALADIGKYHPGTSAGGFDWYPPGEVSAVGFAIDGVHYRGGCDTRYGLYPFCDVLDLPSYSLAKSIFAGMAYMALEQEFPGVGEIRVADYLADCPDPDKWGDVTLQNLLDMTTGNYQSTEQNVDEDALHETEFMSGETHRLKIDTACRLFPRRTEPGSIFVYHTSDTYIAGVLMNAYLREITAGKDDTPPGIHEDIAVERIMKPLGLSPVTWRTRRTYDDVAQPFTGYGLTLHSDDIARIGLFLSRGEGIINGSQVLQATELRAALQRNPGDPGISADPDNLRYNNGFWAFRTDLGGACKHSVWIPMMSGFGGISVAVLPNHSVFYVFSDQGRFEWLNAAVESLKIRDFCNI